MIASARVLRRIMNMRVLTAVKGKTMSTVLVLAALMTTMMTEKKLMR